MTPADILREYDVDLSLRDSENMGPTRSELAMATEIVRLREENARYGRVMQIAAEHQEKARMLRAVMREFLEIEP
jgi:hypothetical protein